MNIEDLSKSQLLLLTILVNFVVSIATGVLTVSLLDQAPATITQTVSQIVDHTIETISSSTPIQVALPVPIIKNTPTVTPAPSNEELLTAAISASASRTVVIYKNSTTSAPIGTGVYLPKARAVATASNILFPNDVIIGFANGAYAPASASHEGATVTIYGFGDNASLPQVAAPSLVAADSLKPGTTVIGITSDRSAITGIVSKVDDAGVHTTLPALPAGAAAVNLAGNIIGISSGTVGLFFPADKIQTLLTATTTGNNS